MAKSSSEYIILCEYVAKKPFGATLDYDTVHRETGLDMAQGSTNRGKLARAIIKSDRRALVFPGIGYELDSADNTMSIVDKAGRRVFNQIKRSSKTSSVVTIRHIDNLNSDDKGKLKAVNAMYATLERKATRFVVEEVVTIKELPQPDIEARK